MCENANLSYASQYEYHWRERYSNISILKYCILTLINVELCVFGWDDSTLGGKDSDQLVALLGVQSEMNTIHP